MFAILISFMNILTLNAYKKNLGNTPLIFLTNIITTYEAF